MDEFENILDLFGSWDAQEYVLGALEIHSQTILAMLWLGYYPERAYFRGDFSGAFVEFRAEEIVKFRQMRAANIALIPVVVWAHPDRAADMYFVTENRLWVEYRTENRE